MEQITKQLDLVIFPPAVMMGDNDLFMWAWGTVRGLVKVGEQSLEFVAIENDMPHNGCFKQFVEWMERSSYSVGFKFSISTFFNPRLRQWFIKRGYAYDKHNDATIYQRPTKKMQGGTVQKIRRMYTVDGFSKGYLLEVYNDYEPRDVLKAIRGLTKAERI